jgi:vancomycin resistance protein YoaR
MRLYDDRGVESGLSPEAGPGPRDQTRPSRAGAPAARGKRVMHSSLFVVAAVVVGAGIPIGHGFLSHGPWRAMAATQPNGPSQAPAGPAAGPPVSGSERAVPSPVPGGGTSAKPASPSSAPPGVDPRIVRALDTRVSLQAAKASVWTELRRLGVRLTWPEAGNPQWAVDEHLFNRGLRRLARRVERLPHNARLIHTAGGFRALPAHPGRMLDRAAARQQLMQALAQPAFRQSLDGAPPEKPTPVKLLIPLRTVAPTVSAAQLGAINTLLATYSTGLGGSSHNRRHNIHVACAAIDGTVLMPGEVFSYNQIVGPRTERAGFRTAPVIIHGELVPGTGGGICQVSSTLYNVALLGDLKIVRRSHHQFPVHYVAPGRDATVAYGSLDLRFANSLPGPVALDVKTAGSRVVVHLYGTAACKRDVQLVSSRVTRSRPRVKAGRGLTPPGKRVIVTRVVRRADGTVRREVISHDSYAPAPTSSHAPPALRVHRRHRRTPGGKQEETPRRHEPEVKPMASAAEER